VKRRAWRWRARWWRRGCPRWLWRWRWRSRGRSC
jgi:hypothetical protein